MTSTPHPGRISRTERIARITVGMPAGHPELVTRKPGRTDWKHLAKWLAEMWPDDEYTAIVAEAWGRDRPPGTPGWR